MWGPYFNLEVVRLRMRKEKKNVQYAMLNVQVCSISKIIFDLT
jgi:hypothetical protein